MLRMRHIRPLHTVPLAVPRPLRHPRTLGILGRPIRAAAPPSPLPNYNRSNPRQPHEAGNHAVRNHAGSRTQIHGAGEFHAQPAVDDAKRDDDAAEPEMPVGPEGAGLVLFEEGMMQEAEDGLEEEAYEDYDADDGMV